MRALAMMVHDSRAKPIGRFTTSVRMGLAVTTACIGITVMPATAHGVESPPSSSVVAQVARVQPLTVRPLICNPEPPDYPGCTADQVRPLLRNTFANEYRGRASGYRYHRMGQHHRGVIFAHLSPALNRKLAGLYREAVQRYAKAHTETTVDKRGLTHVTVAYPRYHTWAGFRANATAFCNGTNITVHFPTQYCWSITKLGQAGRVIARLLNSTLRIAFSCNGYAVGGWASGGFAAWKLGTGVLAGGFYGGVGVEIGCQTTHLFNWVTSLW